MARLKDLFKFGGEDSWIECGQVDELWSKRAKENRLKFELFANLPEFLEKREYPNQIGIVYAWVSFSEDEKSTEVNYIGETDKGLRNRLTQHEGGFTRNKNKEGDRKANNIRAILQKSGTVKVYARESRRFDVFRTETGIHKAEELVLINALQQPNYGTNTLWNLQRKKQSGKN